MCPGHPLTRLLYVTPEYTLTESFRTHIKTIQSQGELSRIAIDEAHCISEWGHDFRPAYCHLSYFRQTYPTVPIICLTATATPSVRKDIIKTLALDPDKIMIFCTSTSRPNLHYEIRFTSDENDERFSSLLSWLQAIYARRSQSPSAPNSRSTAVPGIIYTSFRSSCEDLASRLRSHNIGAAPYHAGLSSLDRTTTQQKWLVGEEGYDIIVATTAFGMGIDKQDVRFVMHWCIPKSFEGYYQEAGRAGRDGRAAACILFYSREDRDRVAYRLGKDATTSAGFDEEKGPSTQVKGRADSFQSLVKYCEGTSRCRHDFIREFFGEVATVVGGEKSVKHGNSLSGDKAPGCDYACDYCKDPQGLKERKKENLASEEWVSTQRERGGDSFYGDGWD